MPNSSEPFTVRRRVEFRDTDAAGIVHFSAFFPMMEAAEHALLRSLGIAVLPDKSDPEAVTWPRVAAECHYRTAARFEDELLLTVRVGQIGNSSVRYEFQVLRGDDLVAEGSLTAVCCRFDAMGHLQKHPIPAAIRGQLESRQ